MFEWANEESRKFLAQGYLQEGDTVENRVRVIADTAGKILHKDEGFADKFYEYMSRGWYSLSSPVWSNFGTERGLPVSCYNSHVTDSMEGILSTAAEVGMMSKQGGGTSAYFGDVRPRGAPIRHNGYSDGSVHFMKLFDTVVDVSRQGGTRRGSMAAYLPIEHKDINEFLKIKDAGNDIQNLFIGVTVGDEWMEEMIAGDVEKREIWAKVLQSRSEKGVPYIFFRDTVNKNKPQVYKDKNMEINASNLCSEIALPSTEDESFVCVLSSMNLHKYDEWKDTDAVQVLLKFLDAVNEEFVQKSKDIPLMERAHKFARRHRALGLGVLGWHSYLQSKNIAFESLEADLHNNVIFKHIREEAEVATKELAEKYGEPEVLEGYGRRNTTLMTIAPTTSSSYILGQVSQSIEPIRSNYYVRDLAKTVATYRNPYLEKHLEEIGRNTEEVWRDILQNDGSVQHLDFLDDQTKAVFKTFAEISQLDIIVQAATRQKHLDQSQSLNIIIHPKTSSKDLNALHLEAWKRGVKTLYYQHSVSAAAQFNRDLLVCSSCEG